jgi:O-methyltransferase domain
MAGAYEFLKGDLGARSQIVGGSFFDSLPADVDAYLLKGVLHDWPDDDAVRILRNTRAAIRPDGTLLLIENIMDSAGRPPPVSWPYLCWQSAAANALKPTFARSWTPLVFLPPALSRQRRRHLSSAIRRKRPSLKPSLP